MAESTQRPLILVGSGPLSVIVERIITCTPVISKIAAYPRKEPDGSYYLVIHIVSDDGQRNTVVPKLCERAKEQFIEAYKNEHIQKLERFGWLHTDSKGAEKMPSKAQILYIRPEAHSG
jgi:hypothetical protein